ncbi:methyl-accepting chemotaxis protein [Roseobacter sp. GAI101]|uniref:methyl-accepting chemotaxis protein n=1 Tax=Roseobacter sp. (strain GAI101) TaxID=391589 RepID=UPI000682836A|nr:methyl-accepting chemotaxis protein [Roseobacter sp. GAI101]
MLANLPAGRKILAAFTAFLLVVLIGSTVLVWSILNVSTQGVRIGERLAPLVDAAMEIKLTATNAHLLVEEIMGGDTAESIDDLYAFLDDSQFYAEAILNGGVNDEGTFIAVEDPRVRDAVSTVLSKLDLFRQAVADRYALLQGDQGVGSDADIEFDALYDDISSQVAGLSARYRGSAAVQQLAGDARYSMAHGHLLVEEALGGDTGEEFSDAIAAFENAVVALGEIRQAEPSAAAEITALETKTKRFADLAKARFALTSKQVGLMENADVVFDETFAQFIKIADEAETLVQEEMRLGIKRVKAGQTVALVVGAVTAIILLTTIFASFVWLDRSLGQRLTQLSKVLQRLLGGDLDVEPPTWRSTDEVGILRDSVDQLRDALMKQVRLERVAEQEKAEADQQRKSAESQRQEADAARQAAEREREETMARAASADRFAREFGAVVERASAGKFDKRIETKFQEPNLDALVQGTNTLMSEVDKGIAAMASVITELAKGDLTKNMNGTFVGDFADLQENVNQMIVSLTSLIGNISESGVTLASSSGELRDTADVLSRQSELNAASLEETSAALEELSASIRQVSENVSDARDNAKAARDTAQSSEKIATDAASSMDRIADASKEIIRVVGVIDDIAFQINLLALNAGVEAARAGDAGRGFSVVASEVRQLAQRAGEASKEIATVIAQSDEAVSEGVTKVTAAKSSLEAIAERVIKISEGVDEVSVAISQQSLGIQEITSAVGKIDQSTQRQAASYQEVTASGSLLASQAEALQQSTSLFKTSAEVQNFPQKGPASRSQDPRQKVAVGAGGRISDNSGWDEF